MTGVQTCALPIYRISINLAQRITLEMLIRDQEVVLVNVGSHDAVYR